MHDRADDLTDFLVERVAQATGLRTVAAAAAAAAQADMVEVRLLAIRPSPQPGGRTRSELLALDYLIAVRLADARAEHQAAAEILFALADDHDLVILDERAAAACRTLGLAPATGVVVRGLVARTRVEERAPLVRFPLEARLGALGIIEGQVQGPSRMPVAGALVSIVGVDRFVRTGADGRFRLVGPGGPPGALRMRVRARGTETEVPVSPGEPAIITLTMES